MHKWLSVPEYSRQTGLSRKEVVRLIENEQLVASKTESGKQYRIKVGVSEEVDILDKKLGGLIFLVEKLCKHLGVKE